MEYKIFNDVICVRFDKGDEIISGISEICKKENIFTATITGIGGCGEIVVGTYNLEKKGYIKDTKLGLFEMISINGNITKDINNNPYIHTHALFSYIDKDGKSNLIGGHLIKAVILLTGEIFISKNVNGNIKRIKDNLTGLNIWNY